MKRILSILLVLAMLLSMIPAVFAANCDITVKYPRPIPSRSVRCTRSRSERCSPTRTGTLSASR